MVAHLEHRLSWGTIGAEVGDAVFNRLIPQGCQELSNAMFHGWSGYAPYGYALREPLKPLDTPGCGVHGPEPTAEELAARQLDIEESKRVQRIERAVDKEVSGWSPEERRIAELFRAPAEDSRHERTSKMPIGPSVGDVFDKGLAELQSAALGMEIQPPQVEAPSVCGPEIEAPASAGPAVDAPQTSGPAIQPMQMPEMEIE